MEHALEVFVGSERVWMSDSRWLYPLFELESVLPTLGHPPAELEVRDRVVGRASALVLVYLAVGSVEAEIMSSGGRDVLLLHQVPHRHGELVPRIGCRTEDLLAQETDPARAWQILRQRAGLASGER